jgi:hypothetical protein
LKLRHRPSTCRSTSCFVRWTRMRSRRPRVGGYKSVATDTEPSF